MEPRGIRRKVDDLGRIVIPAQIRKAFGIAEGDELEVALDGDRVVLAKPAERCTFCGADDSVTTFRGKLVCWSCTAALRALDREHRGDSAARHPF
jgi:AbrB family transcriptional regulator, transcriptional pleiotropic regulator of transition state genes